MYLKGMLVLRNDAERFKQGLNQLQEQHCMRQIASAHASVAESYMTEPMCDEPDAELQCESNLEQALQVHAESLDALQTLAQLRLLRKRDDEAKTLLKRVVNRTMELVEHDAEDQSIGALAAARTAKKQITINNKVSETPSLDFRMQTCRFLTELQMWRESVKLLETIVGDDDERQIP